MAGINATPDFLLIRLREHTAMLRAQKTSSAAALMAAQMFEDLDRELCSTGTLPLDWSDAKVSSVLLGSVQQSERIWPIDFGDEPMTEI